MIVLKIVFTFWCIAMLMSVVLIFTGLFGLVPANVVDVCATFVLGSIFIIAVLFALSLFIIPIYFMWR